MAALLSALALPGSAEAQGDDATRAAAARALFAEGVTAADAEDWALAVDRFERAEAARSSPTIRTNLALALGHLGRVVRAAELLRAVLRDPSVSEPARASATTALAEIEPQIAWLTLSLTGPSDDVTLAIDGTEVIPELLGAPIPVDPGAHHVTALRGGLEVAAVDATLAVAERSTAVLTIPEPPPPDPDRGLLAEAVPDVPPVEEVVPPPVVIELPPPSSGPDPLAVGLGVTGAVLVVGGVVGLVLAFTLPASPTPFVGNVGIIEVMP